jgi:hypothetical protein
VTSGRKIAANRENAKKSCGPKSARGKRWSARNSLRHGLAIPIGSLPEVRNKIEQLALSIANANGFSSITELARRAAEAELDLIRIRKHQAAVFSRYQNQPITKASIDELNKSLVRLERYQRRALSRRNGAL